MLDPISRGSRDAFVTFFDHTRGTGRAGIDGIVERRSAEARSDPMSSLKDVGDVHEVARRVVQAHVAESGTGDLLIIPDSQHALEALEDSAVLLTVTTR